VPGIVQQVSQQVSLVFVFGAVSQALDGRPVDLNRCFSGGKGSSTAFLAAAVVGVLVALGTVACVIPGLIAALMLWVAVPVALVEPVGVMGALSRSAELTHGQKGTIFVIGLALGIILIACAVPPILGVVLLAGEEGVAAWGAFELIGAVMTVAISIPAAVGYHRLALGVDGPDVDEIARTFE
jgi:uncharacterized membrane protein